MEEKDSSLPLVLMVLSQENKILVFLSHSQLNRLHSCFLCGWFSRLKEARNEFLVVVVVSFFWSFSPFPPNVSRVAKLRTRTPFLQNSASANSTKLSFGSLKLHQLSVSFSSLAFLSLSHLQLISVVASKVSLLIPYLSSRFLLLEG